MPKLLPRAAVERYHRDGFFFPFPWSQPTRRASAGPGWRR